MGGQKRKHKVQCALVNSPVMDPYAYPASKMTHKTHGDALVSVVPAHMVTHARMSCASPALEKSPALAKECWKFL